MAQIIIRTPVELTDSEYFCNKSWTLSFNMNTKTWISFHSYIPNWYIAENNFFYSGQNNCCDGLDFIVGVPVPDTTTTSTTTAIPDCNFGDATIDVITTTTTTSTSTSTTTTTTTIFIPSGIVYFNFYNNATTDTAWMLPATVDGLPLWTGADVGKGENKSVTPVLTEETHSFVEGVITSYLGDGVFEIYRNSVLVYSSVVNGNDIYSTNITTAIGDTFDVYLKDVTP